MSRLPIPETFLHQIWSERHRFLTPALRLSDGTPIDIIDGGALNTHRGGPDFLNASIAIDGVVVSGDIELHISPELWNEHGHDHDNRYGNVILHVTLFGDESVAAGPAIPTLVLQDQLSFAHSNLWKELFERLYSREPELACYPQNLGVPMKLKRAVVEKFGDARLEELIDRVTIVDGIQTEAHMLERVYQLTMDALGYSQNRQPFRELSSLIPLERLRYVRQESEATISVFEALYFGMAGLLPPVSVDRDLPTNEYLIELRARWESLQILLRIPETLSESDWAFFRLRPMNSPYRRLALAAELAWKYFSTASWSFSSEYFHLGPTVVDHESYWERHTAFSEPLKEPAQLLGDERRAAIWLNVILPARIGRLRSQATRSNAEEERALMKSWGDSRTKTSAKYVRILQQELLESENVNSVRSEQGGLLLLRNFCEKRRCYECPIGDRLRKQGWSLK